MKLKKFNEINSYHKLDFNVLLSYVREQLDSIELEFTRLTDFNSDIVIKIESVLVMSDVKNSDSTWDSSTVINTTYGRDIGGQDKANILKMIDKFSLDYDYETKMYYLLSINNHDLSRVNVNKTFDVEAIRSNANKNNLNYDYSDAFSEYEMLLSELKDVCNNLQSKYKVTLRDNIGAICDKLLAHTGVIRIRLDEENNQIK